MTLVTDLALLLVTAGLTTLVFKALKQPLILGYIVAGFLVGPHMGLIPSISGTENVEQWSEIGIIFLLFALGLEFSFKKLIKVGNKALILMLTILVGMTIVGLGVGKLLGFQSMECMFLGGIMSMSSTTIIIKAFEDLKINKLPFTHVIYGELIIEDLVAVVLMVLLSTMAATKQFAGSEMLWALAKLLFFVVFWFVVGMFLIPTIFKRGRKFMTEEMLTILAVGLCFLMVVLANLAGFSSALGAFIMGSLLSETLEGEKIEHSVKSIKDLFGAVFFVSVGMLVDPHIIVQYWRPILVLTLVVLTMRPLFATCGVLLGGSGLMAAVRSGLSVGLVGEFGFILVSQGVKLGVMDGYLYPVIVAVSVITTFITPIMMKAGEPFGIWLDRHLPEKVRIALRPAPEVVNSKEKKSQWKRLLSLYSIRVIVYVVLITGIAIGSNYLLNYINSNHPELTDSGWKKLIGLIINLAIYIPFLSGLMNSGKEYKTIMNNLWKAGAHNRGPLLALLLLKVTICLYGVFYAIFCYFTLSIWIIIPISIVVIFLLYLIRKDMQKMSFIEARFFDNMEEKERKARADKPLTTSLMDVLADKDLLIETFRISSDSPLMGKHIKDIDIHKNYNVNILKIMRGSHIINLPKATEIIYPADEIVVIGATQNIKEFGSIATFSETFKQAQDLFIGTFVLNENSFLAGKTIRDSGMRNTGCTIIALERSGNFYLNPDAGFSIEIGDRVWLVGDEAACKRFV
ncbi:MAG: cation:proton antiporter [Bacteroidaceae bacterium]|nr:cation:proton antiporter [Bacteroidaceae bacterium]